MKLHRLANKFWVLAVALVALLAGNLHPISSLAVATMADDEPAAVAALTLDQFNTNGTQGIYENLGIADYLQYLQVLGAAQPLNNVVVAVVDSGIDAAHPLFRGHILEQYAVNFCTRYQNDRSEIYRNGLTAADWGQDDNGHGTHVAGLIANGSLSNVQILPIRIFGGAENQLGYGALEDALQYILALRRGTAVKLDGVWYNNGHTKLNIVAANLSLGTRGILVSAEQLAENTRSDYQKYITSLCNNRILPIVAAGNISTKQNEDNQKEYYSYPAACYGALAVSAYDYYQLAGDNYSPLLANFSYHNPMISLSAPGQNIWSACTSAITEQLAQYDHYDYQDDGGTYTIYGELTADHKITEQYVVRQDADGNYYLRLRGTSMAAPLVTLSYVLLMSDPNRTTGNAQADAQALNLQSWDQATDQAQPYYYMNPQHKALLLAAAKYRDYGELSNDTLYGYGGVYVKCFAYQPETTNNTNQLTNKPAAEVLTPHVATPVYSTTDADQDFQTVFWILAGIVVAVIAISAVRSYWEVRRGQRHE